MHDIDLRLENLYDALERGSFSSEELAPRIRKLQVRRNELIEMKCEAERDMQSSVFELPDIKVVKEYVENLRLLVGSSSIVEQRGFLKSFVKEIRVGGRAVTVNYTLPMPPENSEEESWEFYLLYNLVDQMALSCVSFAMLSCFGQESMKSFLTSIDYSQGVQVRTKEGPGMSRPRV